MRRSVAIAALALSLAGCVSAPAPLQPRLETDLQSLKTRLLVLVQEERTRAGVNRAPLALDPELAKAAQAHSADMAAKGSFDTDNPEGNVAVATLLRDPDFQGFVGENSAEQYFADGAGFDPDAMARGFIAIWMASPMHRSNILDPRFDRIGIGVSLTGNAIYATEVFATDLGLPPPRDAMR